MAASVFFTSAVQAEAVNEWTTIKKKDTDELDKTWTITFTQKVDETSLTEENIFIEDAKGDRGPIKWAVDGYKVMVSP